MTTLSHLLNDVRACTLCAAQLPHGVRPVLQADAQAKILIAGQAPGRKVHASGVPFDDASGDRLRDWLGVDRVQFYDARQVAILPMGFCYPGTGKSGDLPPRPECAPAWRQALMQHLKRVELTLLVGKYAQDYYLAMLNKTYPGVASNRTLTETVQNWRQLAPEYFPLPHPSPRNNIWLRRNPWFEAELLPVLRQRVAQVLTTD